MHTKNLWCLVLIGIFTLNCDQDPIHQSLCDNTDYPEWETSAYILPYPIGISYEAVQGNCTAEDTHWHWNSHQDNSAWAFAYDFLMPIGSIITASRGGEVVFMREHFNDDDNDLEDANVILIKHVDNTYAGYGHLTYQGALVEVGQQVMQGDTIGISGNSGLSYIPHLHFQVSPCEAPENCNSLPITFRNTQPNPRGLMMGKKYKALNY